MFNLDLAALSDNIPVITPLGAGFYIENCMVCFSECGHQSGVELEVHCHSDQTHVVVSWPGEVDQRMRQAYVDQTRFTDNGAVAVALLLIRDLTDYTAVEQSAIGTTIDYYLSHKNDEPTLIFNHAARLEVSGILKENENNSVAKRISEKRHRLIPDELLPSLIAVVEFSKPWSKIVQA